MANPRAAVDFTDVNPGNVWTYAIDGSTVTFDATKANGSAQAGLAVTLSAANTVGLVGDGEFVLGKLLRVEADGFAAVQVKGFCTLPGGTSATLTLGARIVGDLLSSAEGYIQAAASGTAAHHVVSRGFIQDATDTGDVLVFLG